MFSLFVKQIKDLLFLGEAVWVAVEVAFVVGGSARARLELDMLICLLFFNTQPMLKALEYGLHD